MAEIMIVAFIFIIAAGFLCRHFIKALRQDNPACGCGGCGNCPSKAGSGADVDHGERSA
ncbi:MAG: FeoB-associated Cys-rich membrane protein [Pseudomonadota bacterium]